MIETMIGCFVLSAIVVGICYACIPAIRSSIRKQALEAYRVTRIRNTGDYLFLSSQLRHLASIWEIWNKALPEMELDGVKPYAENTVSVLGCVIHSLENYTAINFHRKEWVTELYAGWVRDGKWIPDPDAPVVSEGKVT